MDGTMRLRDLTLERKPHVFSPLRQARLAALINNVSMRMQQERAERKWKVLQALMARGTS